MNTNNLTSSPLTPVCATPDRVISEPVAPWAPERITRPSAWSRVAIDLSAEMDDASSEDSADDLIQRLNDIVFPEMMDVASDNGHEYQEHYTLPDDQLYGNEDTMDIIPNPNFTLFRGNLEIEDEISELDLDSEKGDQDDDDVDTVIAPLDAAMNLGEDDETVAVYPRVLEEEEHEVDMEEERQREAQQIKCGPDFKFVEMNYRDTQGKYPKCCAMCHDAMKYDNVYETSCEHALCCDCYNNHEDASAARCEIIRQGFLSCPVRSCRKTIRKVTGYKKRKDEKLFLDGPMVYCKETGYWVPAASKSK